MNLLRLLLCIPLLFSFLPCSFSQITDNFSDGDFTQNPAWQGDTANFIVNAAGELQLNAPEAGTSMLAVQGSISENVEWNLRFRMEFAPTNANLLRIYLFADQQNLPAANGCFLEIGETGNLDALRLFRQDGAAKTLLATGVAGLVASDPTDIQLRVKHTSTGTWECEAASGNDPLQPQFTLPQTFFDGGANRYFGFQCDYTATRKDKFFFDDISILAVPDTTPPVLLAANADDATQLMVVFDEKLDSLSAVNVTHYNISNGVGQPAAVSLLPDRRSVLLTLAAALASGDYTLQISGLKDLSGNAILMQTADFQFLKIDAATEFDILINEIMADPDPSAGLPDAEWLELFNRSGKTIDLSSLRIQDATGAPVALPAFFLSPGGYVVLTAITNVGDLQATVNGTVLGALIGASTLNNDGDILTLSDLNGNVIDRVAYSIDWHTDPAKDAGGWSLERINPALPCLGGENWQSCPTPPGGTPGTQNASFQNTPDAESPRLLTAFPESATTVLLTFSEGLDKIGAENLAEYRIFPNRDIASAEQLPDDRSRIRLLLEEALQVSTLYALTVESGVTDCSGNSVPATDTAFIILPENAASQDIIINEIMAAPAPPAGGLPEAEWLELLNRSSKAIDLATLRIQDETGSPVPLPSFIFLPGQYIVLTAAANVNALQMATSGKVIGVSLSATALNNDGDALTLSNLNGNVIDRVVYGIDWHTDMGKAGGGWSLERINPSLPCLGRENWQSCPILPGGTPALQNAAYQNTTDNAPPRIHWVFTESATSLLLTFSEDLDKNAAQNPFAYQLIPPRNIVSAEQLTGLSQIRLILVEPLQSATLYTLTIESSLVDCSGNAALATDTAFVGLPEKPDIQDIVVNEIMFNPAPNNGRYLEFYNRSNKIFNWSEFFIANFSGGVDVKKIVSERLFIPGQFHVFTEFPNNIRNSFANIYPDNILDNDLPSMADDAGNITLYWSINGETVVVDSFDYSEDWHNALFTDSEREGVALERIDPDGFTNSASNWTSASPVVTGAPGTPTLPNSQHTPTSPSGSDLIQLPQTRLSPDDDGFEDFLPIHYLLPQAGFGATMTIFDSEGIPVKHIVRQELIGTEGSLRWDGDLDDGTRAKPGIYVLFLELYGPDGTTERVKKAVAVVGRF